MDFLLPAQWEDARDRFGLWVSLPCLLLSVCPSDLPSRVLGEQISLFQSGAISPGGQKQEWPNDLKSAEGSSSIYCELRPVCAWSRSCACSRVQHSSCWFLLPTCILQTPALGWAAAPAASWACFVVQECPAESLLCQWCTLTKSCQGVLFPDPLGK